MKIDKQQLKLLVSDFSKPKPVQVDDYTFYIRSMTLGEQLQMESALADKDNNKILNNVLFYSCVEENGDQLFESSEEVGSLPAPLATRLFKAALDLNKIDEQEIEAHAKN